MACYCLKPIVGIRRATCVGQYNPFVACGFHSQCDGQFLTAHVSGGVGDESIIQMLVGNVPFQHILGFSISFFRHYDDFEARLVNL